MRDRASDLRAIADGRLMLNVRSGVTVSRSMLAMIADEFEAMSTALAAKDEEMKGWKKTATEYASELHSLRSQLAEARKALANYDRWLNGRDAYIVQKGLWQNFVASLPGSPTARRALEAQGGENG